MQTDLTPAALVDVFLQEAEEGLTAMEQALIELDAQPDGAAPLNEVFRIAHTIKGGAAMVDFPAVAELAHRFEDALTLMRDGLVSVTPERVTVMLQVMDVIRAMIATQSQNGAQPVRVRAADAALIARLIPAELQAEAAPHDQAERDAPAGPEFSGAASATIRSLRVEKTKLDSMLTLSGEIAVAKGRLMQTLAAADVGEAGLTAAEHMSRLLATLHECVTQMRLVPIGPLFRQHMRTVRDVGATQSKLLRLVLEGEDVEVDATIIEQLRDPLTHLVRNAVDHGVEFPAARRDAGKDPCGTIVLHARHERGTVIVEIRDDGQGMSKERILAKARERGLVGEGDHLTDAQVFALAMAPGLSTAARVTELSGRGVGMDVVRKNVEAMRGSIEIVSTEGVGTTVRLHLPLTVAIIDGFVVSVADERYVIPVAAVSECLAASDTTPGAATGVISVRGASMPYIRLRHLLTVDKALAVSRECIVIVNAGGQQAGLVVDELLGETQAVIKPLGGLCNAVPGVSGTTIMSDGRVSLILDIGPLLELAHRSVSSVSSISSVSSVPSSNSPATQPVLS
jgi:two-component system, chemotaxis family, sensor kinase CheA